MKILARLFSARSTLVALVCAAALSALSGASETSPPPPEPPARNFSLPAFTKEGYRSFLLRASTARFVGQKEIELRDTNLTVFTGDASNAIETIILSPIATFLTDQNIAQGPGPVRLIRDDMEITGTGWRYDHAHKTVSITKNTRVVFHTPLPDLIQ